MFGAGFVVMKKQLGFIGLQDRHICARILITEFSGLTNKIEIEFKDSL
jgi:hypothetical protein